MRFATRAARLPSSRPSALLAFVALAACPIAGATLWRRSLGRERLALRHEVVAEILRTRGSCEIGIGEVAIAGRVAYHRELGAKYRRAASRPWLSIEADPPPPPRPTPAQVAREEARIAAIAAEALALDRARRAAGPGR